MSSLFMDNDICYQGTDDVQVYRLTRALAITIYRELPYTFHKRLGFIRQLKMKHPLNKINTSIHRKYKIHKILHETSSVDESVRSGVSVANCGARHQNGFIIRIFRPQTEHKLLVR